jgi:hypothetical protein
MVRVLRQGSPICPHLFKKVIDNKAYCSCGWMGEYDNRELLLSGNNHRVFIDKAEIMPTVHIKYEGYTRKVGLKWT